MDERLLKQLRPENLVEIVGRALAAPDDIDAYGHANGFAKLILATSAEGVVVRAHLWHELGSGAEQEGENVPSAHNHRWDFCSRVLSGTLSATIFRPVSGGGPYTHYRYRPADQDEMELVGPANLERISEVKYGAGDCYFTPHDAVHVARPSADEPLVTLIAHSASLRPYADVYTTTSPRLGERSEHVPRAELIAQLQLVHRLLTTHGETNQGWPH